MNRALVLLLLLAACSDPHAEARAAALEQAQTELATDAGAALRTVHAVQAEHGDDPRLDLVAGLAHLQLEQRTEAIKQADAGLSFENLTPELRAELFWVRGSALMSRFMELSAPDDWRDANTALESATVAGAYRVRAATALAFLQTLGTLGNNDRLLKFARLVLQLEPDGESATKVRALCEQLGLKP